MGTDLYVIDVDHCLPVDSVKIEHQSLAFPRGRDSESGLVPKGIIRSHLSADTGK